MLIQTIQKWFEAFESKFVPFERDSKHSKANSNYLNGIRGIQVQIPTIRKGFERHSDANLNNSKGFKVFECKFQPFNRDSKHSNANSNYLKMIRSTWMQIRTQIPIIWKGFEAFEHKFEQFKKDLKQSNPNSKHLNGIASIRMQILTFWKKFEAFKSQFEPLKRDSKHSNPNCNHSNQIWNIRMQILTIWTRFQAFKRKF